MGEEKRGLGDFPLGVEGEGVWHLEQSHRLW